MSALWFSLPYHPLTSGSKCRGLQCSPPYKLPFSVEWCDNELMLGPARYAPQDAYVGSSMPQKSVFRGNPASTGSIGWIIMFHESSEIERMEDGKKQQVKVIWLDKSGTDKAMARVPKMARGKSSLARGIHCSPIFFLSFFCPTSVSILWGICVYIHISDFIEIVHELPLLPNNTASATFLPNGERCEVLTGYLTLGWRTWRWQDECVTLDKTF
jgi:hypothetical protein